VTAQSGERRLLIDGKLVDSESGATFDNVNPATLEVLGPVADATPADMVAAIAAARRAFDTTTWATDHAFRRDCLHQLQAALVSEQEELRAELVSEVGCPVLLTYGPQLDAPLREALTWPADQIESFPWARSLGPKDAFGMGQETEREVWREAIGVVGVIVPWNFPVEIILNKLGPVLAMGNTCVLKPAPDTPWNATRLGRLIAEKTDIPPGVVNVVVSSDHLVGEVLTTSPDVDMVAFTGSTATGRRIMAAAAETVKPVFLELGGKSINLVLDDADFSSIGGLASSVCFHGGQGCAMPTRMLVPRSRYDEAVDLAAAGFAGVRYGDPTDASTAHDPGSVGPSALDVAQHPVPLALRHQRAHEVAGVGRVAVADPGEAGRRLVDGLVVARPGHQQPRRHGAALAAVEAHGRRRRDHGRQVGVVEHEVDRLAAQLEEDGLQGLGT